MFSLLQGLWRYFFRKDEYFVVILGLDNAGKTVWGNLMHPTNLSTFIYYLFTCNSYQTLLESTKRLYINNYQGMSLDKITTTVGLNGMVQQQSDCGLLRLGWALDIIIIAPPILMKIETLCTLFIMSVIWFQLLELILGVRGWCYGILVGRKTFRHCGIRYPTNLSLARSHLIFTLACN